MARNFLISYTGRVGSTALIDSLKMLPNFLIPIFEDLDYWALERDGKLDKIDAETIDGQIDYVYRNHQTDFPNPQLSIGFKWRIWGNPEKVSNALKRHDVLVFNLMRADLLEMTSSLYLSNVVYKDFNSHQFQLKDATDDAQKSNILEKYRSRMVEADLDAFYKLIDEQIEAERQRLDALSEISRYQVPVQTILYEDFAFQRVRFLNAMLAALDNPALTFIPDPVLKKVTLAYPSELLTNRAEILRDPRLMKRLEAWSDLIDDPDLPVLHP